MGQQREIGGAEAGQRVDRALAAWLALSRREVTRLIERGLVSVNDSVLARGAKGRLLDAGDRLAVESFVPESAQRAAAEPALSLHVVSEGDGWLIADKPAHMAVHPLRTEQDGTLLNALIARHPEIHGVGEGGLRSGVVHRLDLTTTGTVLFALHDAQWQRLRDAFRTHAMRKTYDAIVHGRLHGERRETLSLHIRQHHPARVAVALAKQKQARQCTLTWRALATFADATHVEVELGTGFLHQIRVMLAHLGHPIVGDAVYGHADGVERPMLHARSLAFEEVAGQCALPGDFTAMRARLTRNF